MTAPMPAPIPWLIRMARLAARVAVTCMAGPSVTHRLVDPAEPAQTGDTCSEPAQNLGGPEWDDVWADLTHNRGFTSEKAAHIIDGCRANGATPETFRMAMAVGVRPFRAAEFFRTFKRAS